MTYSYNTRDDDFEDVPEPHVDVCQGCGAYFDWDGMMRQEKLRQLGMTDGAQTQRCYKCL